MTGSRSKFRQLLVTAPTTSLNGIFVRRVAKADYDRGKPPSYLFTSGAANRLNPIGVHALYLSEDEETARIEQETAWSGMTGGLEPTVVFRARARIAHALDLEDPNVLSHLGLHTTTLFRPWVLAKRPTRLQHLGAAVAAQNRVGAVRYPSKACHTRGLRGWNVVIYHDAIKSPNRVEILGPKGVVIEAW